ncbi:helix-turn-helix domain-containing protein [Pedobacter sp. UYP30]
MQEACSFLGKSRTTVYNWMKSKRLACQKFLF